MMTKQELRIFLRKTGMTFLAAIVLLAGCVVLQPAKARADTNAVALQILDCGSIAVEEGGAPQYLKNKSYTGLSPVLENGSVVGVEEKYTGWTQEKGSAEDWNIKFEWPTGGVPTLTLKDARLDNIGDDGRVFYLPYTDGAGKTQYLPNAGLAAISPEYGLRKHFALQVILQGDNRVDAEYGVIRGALSAVDYLYNITILGEDGGKLTGVSKHCAINTGEGSSLRVENAVLDLTVTQQKSIASAPLCAQRGSITIQNSTVTVRNENNAAIAAMVKGDITIEDSTVNAYSNVTGESGSEEEFGAIHAVTGNVTVTGSKLNVEAVNNTGIWASSAVTVTNSHLQLKTGAYGIAADSLVEGGSLTVSAKSGAFQKRPVLKDLQGLAGVAEDEASAYEDSKYQAKWLQMYEDATQAPPRLVVSYKEADVVALDKYAQVTSDGADVWSKPYATEGSSKVRTEQNKAILSIVGKVTNSAGSLWYQLSDGNWIHSGNLRITVYKPEAEKTPKLGYVITKWKIWVLSDPDLIDGTETRAVAKGAKLGVDEVKEESVFTWYRLTDGGWVKSDWVETLFELPATEATAAPAEAPTTAPATKPLAQSVTAEATAAPTVKPAQTQTTGQTQKPAAATDTKATQQPTAMPIARPTAAATAASTAMPAVTAPTEVAAETTQAPATEATEEPTAAPTETPTAAPTGEAAPSPSTEAAAQTLPEPSGQQAPKDKKGGAPIGAIIAVVAAVVVIGAGDAAFILVKKKKK